jgi:hypothetical protein
MKYDAKTFLIISPSSSFSVAVAVVIIIIFFVRAKTKLTPITSQPPSKLQSHGDVSLGIKSQK